jgi:DNA-binding transcriptional MerR regulator
VQSALANTFAAHSAPDQWTLDLERALIHSVTDVEQTYSIDEAAQRTGVSAHTLRYYERIGLLKPVGRANSGHRRYSEGDLGSVGFLTLLRQTGMPIRDMLRFVELTRAGEQTVPQRVEVLEAHRDALAEQLALLKRHFAAIEAKIGVYRALLGTHEELKEYA